MHVFNSRAGLLRMGAVSYMIDVGRGGYIITIVCHFVHWQPAAIHNITHRDKHSARVGSMLQPAPQSQA